MHLSIYEQCEIFYYSFLFGLCIGAYYDVYRLIRYLGFTSKAAVIAQDIIFMSTAAVATFIFSQTVVHGHIRLFVLFGELFGCISYRYSIGMLSGFVFSIIHKILKAFSKLLQKLTDGADRISRLCALSIVNICRKIRGFFKKHGGDAKKVDIN